MLSQGFNHNLISHGVLVLHFVILFTENILSVRRKFKNDVPTALTKSAPEFCTVYVISKGKVATVRSANRPLPNTATPPKQPFPVGLPPSHPDQDESIK